MNRRRHLRAWIAAPLAAATIVLAILMYVTGNRAPERADEAGVDTAAFFVGGARCTPCHGEQYRRWRGSHHDRAMAPASDSTVLGDFDGATFESDGVITRFFRRDGGYYVRTAGPDGRMGEFEVAYTFGYEPLQQYLIPMAGGRVQVLGIGWDVEREAWFDLYPEDVILPGDWLHWTGNGQTWNGMCAECHSTNLRKGFDPVSGTFSTTWSDIDVGCEACHGPGSSHVEWAERGTVGKGGEPHGLLVPTRGMAGSALVERCAPCHSRRSEWGDYDHTEARLLDRHVPELLREGVYYPDGQILGEVYVYGSFIQSAMYRSGVGCDDCHDVHSLELIEEGDALCLRCHEADTYDTFGHHHHPGTAVERTPERREPDRRLADVGAPEVLLKKDGPPHDPATVGEVVDVGPTESQGTATPSCVTCHMPERTYMVVDDRADHSFRIPRPDLTGQIGVPNACNQSGCHDDRSSAWAAGHVERWYGPNRRAHFGKVLAEGREGRTEARTELVRMAADTSFPAIVRATALSLLGAYANADDEGEAALSVGLTDADGLVRYTALGALSRTGVDDRVTRVVPLLSDPVRAVRLLAASQLAGVPAAAIEPRARERLRETLAEYRQAMERSLDLSSAGHNLGNLAMRLGQPTEAERYYRAAIAADDRFFPAKMNLAVLYSATGRKGDAEVLLRQVLDDEPDMHEAAYSLGLLLAEDRTGEAVEFLGRAAAGMPGHARVHYNLGLALQLQGQSEEAEAALRRALELVPGDMDYLYALGDHFLKRGMLREALEIAERMTAAHPSSTAGRDLKAYVERALRDETPR